MAIPPNGLILQLNVSAQTQPHIISILCQGQHESLQLSCSVSAIPEANLRALQKPSVVSDQSQQIRSSTPGVPQRWFRG